MQIRKAGAPDGMRVQHGPRLSRPRNCQMRSRFGRRLSSGPANGLAIGADQQHIRRPNRALRNRARRDNELEGFAGYDRAEVSARSEDPAAGVEIAADLMDRFTTGLRRVLAAPKLVRIHRTKRKRRKSK